MFLGGSKVLDENITLSLEEALLLILVAQFLVLLYTSKNNEKFLYVYLTCLYSII